MMFAALLTASILLITPECISPAERQRLLTLDYETFDQSGDGWRATDSFDCALPTIDLILEYRDQPARAGQPQREYRLLTWHAGRILAREGAHERAIHVIREAIAEPEDQAESLEAGIDWNSYVTGTIAFLEGDRATLRRAIENLDTFGQTAETQIVLRERGFPPGFIPNLEQLSALEICFDQTYLAAISGSCLQRARAHIHSDEDVR